MKTKTRSKWLALLLTVTLLMSLFVGIVKAADESAGEVCTVGTGAKYATLKEAFASAPNGATIQLSENITGFTTDDMATVDEGKTLILDMNGKSLTVDSSFTGRPIVNNGTLTVTGNGTIDSSASEFGGYGAINNFGVLTIENGTFRGSIMADGAAVYVRPGSEAVINGGTFEGTCAVNSAGKLTVNNGIFNTTSCNQTTDSNGGKNHWAYCVRSEGELYFNNGTVTGVQGGLGISSGYAEVKGGTFQTVGCEHNEAGAYSFYALYIAGEVGEVEAHISGGTFTAAKRAAVLCGNDNTNGDGGINAKATARISGGTFIGGSDGVTLSAGKNTGDPEITGGTFSTQADVAPYVAGGNTLVPNEDGSFSLKIDEATAVAKVDGVGYTTLQAAVDALAASQSKTGSVTLITSTAEDIVIPAGADITLNLPAGITLTNVSAHTITNHGKLTVTGTGTVDSIKHARAALYNSPTGNVTIWGGEFTRSQEAGTYEPYSNGGNSFYTIQNQGVMVIGAADGGDTSAIKVHADGGYSSLIANGYQDASKKDPSAPNPSLTIYGGTFGGGINTVKNDEAGYLTINEGEFNNYVQHSVQNWNVGTINGGTFTSENTPALYNGTWGDHAVGDLSVTNGKFDAGTADIFMINENSAPAKVSGGTFSNEIPEEYCEENFHPIKNPDGSYSVHVHQSGEAVRENEVDSSCTVKGHYDSVVYCTLCKEELSRETIDIDVKDHSFGEWETVTSPNCTDKGSEKRVCSVCQLTETRDLDATGHEWETDYTVDKAATCTTDGSKSIHCKHCDAVKDSEVIAATGHVSDEGAVTTPATETTEGVKTYTCTVCGEVLKKETIPAVGHSFGTEWKFDDKDHWHECVDCDAADGKAAHTYGDWVVTKAATETAEGEQVKTCTVCGHQVTETIPASKEAPKTGGTDHAWVWFTLCNLSILAGVMITRKRKALKRK